MNKSRLIALGGWLGRLIGIATRGWFGETAELAQVESGETAVNQVEVVDMAVFHVLPDDHPVYTLVLSEHALGSVQVDDEVNV